MVENITAINNADHWSNFYITSGGRIWGVVNEDKLKGEAQERRNVIGNSFSTVEEACYVKNQLEAWARLKKYVERRITFRNGNPVLELEFHLPAKEGEIFNNDVMLLANKYQEEESYVYKDNEAF